MARHGRIVGPFGLTLLAASVTATPAAAQPLGTFRWQTQPFCNVLTLAVTATPTGFRMEGTDDQCGGTPASVIGMAYPKPDGTVGAGLTLVFSSAVSLHVDATIVPGAGFSGSWSDSVGRNGTLFLTPGASLGGPVRPVVAPVVTYGSTVVQPTGGTDRGLSATVTTDTGAPNDAAGLYGRFGGPLPPGLEGPAGVRGESAASAGVFGRSDSGIGVVGGTNAGVGVQGHAVGASGMGVQAHHVNGGTALEINNGAVRVGGAVRAAFSVAVGPNGCAEIDHSLLNDDPTALLFLTAPFPYFASTQYVDVLDQWVVCLNQVPVGTKSIAVLVIKQGP